jgi:putative phage-type endonuclease
MYHEIEQNSDEWMALRLGKFTASSFADLFMKPTTTTYQKAIYKAVFERMTGEETENFTNSYMERGHELEPFAREEYETQTFTEVQNGGFFELNEWVGCSPDGLVGTNGIIEIKCPAYNTMIQYLIDRKLPSQYKYQVYGQLYVTGRKWCDFMAYHPKLKPLIIRIERDETIIKEIENKLNDSIKEAKRIIELIK